MYFTNVLVALSARGNAINYFAGFFMLAAVAHSAEPIEPSGKPYSQARYNIEVSDVYMSGLTSYHKVLAGLGMSLDSYIADEETPLAISEEMKQNISTFLNRMILADRNIKILIKDVDASVEQSADKISNAESQIISTKKLIEEAKVRITGAQKKIELATTKKQTLEANLRTHQEALRLAKERKDKARHGCLTGGRRLKRGIFGKIRGIHNKISGKVGKIHGKIGGWRSVFTEKLPGGNIVNKLNGIIETGACEAMNVVTGQIDKEKKAVDTVKATIAVENGKLEAAKKEVKQAEDDKIKKTKALEDDKASLKLNKNLLQGYKKARDMLIEVSIKLKNANTLISSIKTRAEAVKFNTELGFMLDVNGIITPLSEIADIVLQHNTEKTRGDYEIDTPTTKIEETWRKLKKIAAKADE